MKTTGLVLNGVFAMIAINLSLRLHAAEYHVSPQGNDENPGTGAKPFKTIQRAATVMQAGDRCLIRAGTYRETVVPTNSGKEQAPITFEAFEGERVVISGADILPGPWKPYKGKIVKTTMPWTLGPGKDMVFVDGIVGPAGTVTHAGL